MLPLVRCLDNQCRTMSVDGGTASASRNSVEISASVGEDAHNRVDDVRIIQDALNQVPADSGGPIAPLKVDGLCYGKTLAAIRRFQKEACEFKWPDGRVEPERKTHRRLKEFFIPANPYTMPRVYVMLPQASLWIMAARRVLGDAEMHLSGAPGFTTRYDLVNKYFHVNKLSSSDARASIVRIRSTFVAMEACIGHSSALTTLGSGYFQEDPFETRGTAYTFEGGFTRRSRTKSTPPMSKDDNYAGPNQRQDTIFVCPRVLNAHSDEFYTKVIVHELAHFCGPEPGRGIGDHGYRNGNLSEQNDPFFKLTPEFAIRTADCYSEFAGSSYLQHEPAGR